METILASMTWLESSRLLWLAHTGLRETRRLKLPHLVLASNKMGLPAISEMDFFSYNISRNGLFSVWRSMKKVENNKPVGRYHSHIVSGF